MNIIIFFLVMKRTIIVDHTLGRASLANANDSNVEMLINKDSERCQELTINIKVRITNIIII